MTLVYCPVDDCCGGTIIRDNGMRARVICDSLRRDREWWSDLVTLYA